MMERFDRVKELEARVAELEEALKLTRGAMDAQDRREREAVVVNNEGLLERTIRERDEAREQRDRYRAAWWELEKNRCREYLTAGGGNA